MMRLEYVSSLLVAFFIVCGTMVWTAASQPTALPTVVHRPADAWQASRQRPICHNYAQYEFKVGYLVSPGCLPQAD